MQLTKHLVIAALLIAFTLMLAPARPTHAAGPSDGRAPTLLRGLTLADQSGGRGMVTLSAMLSSADGSPAHGEQVVFYEMSTVFGERLMNLGSAMTDATGAAELPYAPTWPGEHTVVVRYGGDGELSPAQTTFRFESTAPAHSHQNAEFGLATPRKWAPLGGALAVLGVWGVLGLVVTRTVFGILNEAPATALATGGISARRPLRPASISPLLGALAVLAGVAVFVGLILPATRGEQAPLAGPAISAGGHAVEVSDSTFASRLTQTIPGFLTDEEGVVTPNSPNLPADVVTMDGRIFVLDTNSGRLLTVTPDGQLARIFESDPDGQTSVARAVAMTSHASEIYVAAPLFGNVLELSAAGRVDAIIQPQLPKAARPFQPAGVAVTKSGDIWLSDANNHRVVLVNASGTLLSVIGGGPAASGDDEFAAPAGLTVDAQGRLWVADTGRHEIREYSANGTFIKAIAQAGLSMPVDVAVDSFGRLFVTDRALREVRVFGPDGAFLGSIGKSVSDVGGPSDSGLQYPQGVEVDGDHVYVMDRLAGMFVYQVGAQ
jgi:sugar lactone lactonase YvrE